jgi:GWxTD domain-containing protein
MSRAPDRQPGHRRRWTAVLVLVAGTAGLAAGGNEADPAARARVKALRSESKRNPGNDSLRYELALAEAATGTIDGRIQALSIFEDIRHVYEKDVRYHRDRARIYEACQQPSEARRCYEDLLEIDPDDVPARVCAARLALVEILYHYDLRLTRAMTAVLEPALALEPDHRDVLFLHSLALELGTGIPSGDSPTLSRRGLAEAERLVAIDSTDYQARFLAAVHAMDLGQVDRAARAFDAGLAVAPDDVRAAFLTSRWTAPVAAVVALESRDAAGRAAYDRAYWRHHDPTPLTAVNENQLEIWKRLALADFLFSRPKRGLRGWDTEPGLAFVRYGPPHAHAFDPGEIIATGPGPDTRLPHALINRSMASSFAMIRLVPPAWEWDHEFKGLRFSLHFQDKMLNGDFLGDNATRMTLDKLRLEAPVVFHEAPPGQLRWLAVTAAGVLDRDRRVNTNVYLGVPLWRPLGDGRWLDDVTVELTVRDSARAVVRQARHTCTADDVVPMLGRDIWLLLFNQPWSLPPGQYTMTGYVEDTDRRKHGVYTGPLLVRSFAPVDGPVISDLDLTLRPATDDSRVTVTRLGSRYVPNPLRVATDDRQIDIFYEVYGLTERTGTAFVGTNYRVLPRAWVEGFDRLVRAGEETAARMLDSADEDFAAPGGELTRENYLDVTFPPAGLDLVGGRAARGTRVPIPDLVPGEYALVMTITDLHTGAGARADTWFQVLSPAQRAELAAMANPAAARSK